MRRKIIHNCLFAGFTAFYAAPAAALITGDDHGDNSAAVKATVRDIAKPPPTIKVKSSDGKSYNTVDSPTAVYFKAKYSGACRLGWTGKKGKVMVKANWNGSKPYTNTALWDKSTQPSGRYNSGEMSVGGFLDNSIKQRVYAVCNTLVKNGKVPGQTTTLTRHEDIMLVYKLSCKKNDSSGMYGWQSAILNYRCEGYVPRVPATGQSGPQRDPDTGHETLKFQVTKLVVNTNPKKYVGTCPAKIKFGAAITANRDGLVKYRWQTSTSGMGPTHNLAFQKIGTKYTPQPTLTIDEKGAIKSPSGSLKAPSQSGQVGGLTQTPPGVQNHFVKLHIVSPTGQMKTAEKHFTVECKKPTSGGFKAPSTSGGSGGGQGSGKADITFTKMKLGKKRFYVGAKSKPWTGTLQLNAGDATKTLGNGKCEFPYKYSIVNRGGVVTEKAFKAVLKMGNQTQHTKNNIILNPQQAKWVAGKFQLSSGNHTLSAILDSNNKVNESKENNNSRTIKIQVNGCG